jgi:hypothetical protein
MQAWLGEAAEGCCAIERITISCGEHPEKREIDFRRADLTSNVFLGAEVHRFPVDSRGMRLVITLFQNLLIITRGLSGRPVADQPAKRKQAFD